MTKRTAATKLQSWWRYLSDVVGAKQPWRPISFACTLERLEPLVAERWSWMLVWIEEAFAARCFGNWRGGEGES